MKQICGIYIPNGDEHFGAQIAANPLVDEKGTYQYNKIEAALRMLPPEAERPRRLALDIGAHVGLWTRVLALHFDRVDAFEPVPDLADCFVLNVGNDAKIRLHRKACSDRRGTYSMDCPGNHNSGNWCAHDVAGDEAPDLFVDAVRLDEFYPDEIVDFFKIDVEGWELRVVRGAEALIRRSKPIMVVEQKPGNAERYGAGRTDAVDLLRSWGAEELWIKSGDYCLGWG